MKTLVLIPAKNEEKKIGSVVSQVKSENFEVLVVDDGSTDATARIARNAGAKVLIHAVNRGQGASLKTGIAWALEKDYEAVVFFDADGQMKAEEIKKLLEPLYLEKYEAVLGSRFLGKTENMPFSRYFTLKSALFFTKITTGLKLTDVHNGFQAWSREGLQKMALNQDRQAYASEILNEIAKKRIKFTEVPVTIAYTEYSKRKGQKFSNAFRILWDLTIKR